MAELILQSLFVRFSENIPLAGYKAFLSISHSSDFMHACKSYFYCLAFIYDKESVVVRSNFQN